MNCPDLISAIDRYRSDELGSPELGALRSHLRECGECRLRAFDAEPSILFAVENRPVEVTPEEVQSVLENVRIGIALSQTSRRIETNSGGRGKSRRLGALSAAALLLLSVTSPSRRTRAPIPASAVRELPAAAVPAGFEREGEGGLLPASATIYEWNPASAAPNDPKIVWIVDRSLDL